MLTYMYMTPPSMLTYMSRASQCTHWRHAEVVIVTARADSRLLTPPLQCYAFQLHMALWLCTTANATHPRTSRWEKNTDGMQRERERE